MIKNQRRERFARELAAGKTAKDAYVAAGYSANDSNAAQLSKHPEIQQRLTEINSMATEHAVISKAWILNSLQEVAQRCMGDKWNAMGANKALELLGKEAGMFIERQEVGQPGTFAEMTDDQKRERAMALSKELGLAKLKLVS